MTGPFSGRPRLLIFCPSNKYINPTEAVFLDALELYFDTFFYGPGFVKNGLIINDAMEVFYRFGPFDAVVLHQYFLFNNIVDTVDNISYSFDVNEFVSKYPGFPKNYENLPCPIFYLTLRIDPYAITKQNVAKFDQTPGYFISWPEEFIKPQIQEKDIEKEIFGSKIKDNYLHFAHKNRKRIIPVPHTIAEQEFMPINWERKTIDISVPGTIYFERKEALKKLRECEFKVLQQYRYVSLTKVLAKKIGVNLGTKKYGIRFLNRHFRRQINASRFCYTDGSRLRYPIRKYFEIPAYGAVLLADPCAAWEGLGFVDGVNSVRCSANEVIDVVSELTKNPDRAKTLAENGQMLIKKQHSKRARGKQFLTSYQMIKSDMYQGALWDRGEFILSSEKKS